MVIAKAVIMPQAEIYERQTRARKPDTVTAMRELIRHIRASIPFDAPDARICSGACQGCSMKLLDFLSSELEDCERDLDAGVKPTLKDLSRLIGMARKVHDVLRRHGLVDAVDPSSSTSADAPETRLPDLG